MSSSADCSRRQFLLACTSGLMLLNTGCRESGKPPASAFRSRLSNRPVNIGPAENFRQPGVYSQFAREHGLFVASNPHGLLVALADGCTCHTHRLAEILEEGSAATERPSDRIRYRSASDMRQRARSAPSPAPTAARGSICAVSYDSLSRVFRCPCHGTIYDGDGLVRSGIFRPDAGGIVRQHKWSLARLGIRTAFTQASGSRDLIVDPRYRYLHEENQWSHPSSGYTFR